MIKEIYLPDVVGRGYKKFWNYEGRYRVVKGSRGSKKSKTTALWHIYNMMKYKESNTLVIRKTYRTLKDSCFTELRWAIKRLGVERYWKVSNAPLEMEYIPTGQKIYFRGMDDPLKVTSITVDVGVLSFMWIEEAYEIESESDFNMLDESIRGSVEKPLFKQITLTLNPWSENHWIKGRFFDTKNKNILAMTTTYKCNEWLDKADKQLFRSMKKNNPSRYEVAGLGKWGIAEGLVFNNFSKKSFDVSEMINQKYADRTPKYKMAFGLDFGFSVDPTAFVSSLVDTRNKELYIYDEFYKTQMLNKDIYDEILSRNLHKAPIIADSASSGVISELKVLGLRRIKGAKKGSGSILSGIQTLKDYKIYIHPNCKNAINEFCNYTWEKDKVSGKLMSKPVDKYNHLIDALRYSIEDIDKEAFFW